MPPFSLRMPIHGASSAVTPEVAGSSPVAPVSRPDAGARGNNLMGAWLGKHLFNIGGRATGGSIAVRELIAASLKGSEVAVQGFSTAGGGGTTRGDRLRFTVVVALLVGVAAAAGCVAGLLTSPGVTAERATTARHGLTSLPLAAQGPVSAALGSEKPAYRVTGLEAVNPAQHLRAGFSRHGVTVASGEARLGMTLSAYGYAGALETVGSAQPRASANRVSYAHGALTRVVRERSVGNRAGL